MPIGKKLLVLNLTKGEAELIPLVERHTATTFAKWLREEIRVQFEALPVTLKNSALSRRYTRGQYRTKRGLGPAKGHTWTRGRMPRKVIAVKQTTLIQCDSIAMAHGQSMMEWIRVRMQKVAYAID